MSGIVSCEPTMNTSSQENIRTTTVRTAVATVESVSRMPHLAKIEATPARMADPNANNIHIANRFLARIIAYLEGGILEICVSVA